MDAVMSEVNHLREQVGMEGEGRHGLFEELFEEESDLYALHQNLHDLFVPKQDEFKMRLSYDDDKQWFNVFVNGRSQLLREKVGMKGEGKEGLFQT